MPLVGLPTGFSPCPFNGALWRCAHVEQSTRGVHEHRPLPASGPGLPLGMPGAASCTASWPRVRAHVRPIPPQNTTINITPLPDLPVITSPAAITILEDELLQFGGNGTTLSVYDPDGRVGDSSCILPGPLQCSFVGIEEAQAPASHLHSSHCSAIITLHCLGLGLVRTWVRDKT